MQIPAKDAGPVTAVAISQDHTFVAVGHALGSIHLYALAKPAQPARSVAPTTLALILTGRKEGHLAGSRILHLGFVGARHTAIVSSDDTGLAFYHSLGKVLMLASTDIIRMLGRYPDPASQYPTKPLTPTSSIPSSPANGTVDAAKHKRPATILDMAPLPLGPSPHSTDSHSLVALLTPTKLVVVGLKPTPRTWWRATPPKDGESDYARNGVLAWFPSIAPSAETRVTNGTAAKGAAIESGEDPLLAFAWGRTVRLVKMRRESAIEPKTGEKEPVKVLELEFVEVEGWDADGLVLGLQWYSERVSPARPHEFRQKVLNRTFAGALRPHSTSRRRLRHPHTTTNRPRRARHPRHRLIRPLRRVLRLYSTPRRVPLLLRQFQVT